MASDNEPAKLLLPYLQRADELQKHEPLVAYYCRLYAMERGLKIPQSERTRTTNSLLISLMKQLEKDKKSLQLGPDDHFHLEGFASNVFAKADKQDRAGRADLNTAKTFYAASIFFEILNQFGELLPDLEQKQKYAAWKAADIRKAIKEGRKPVPGPPGGDKELSMLSSTFSGEYDLDPSRTDEADLRTEPDPSPQFHDQVHHPHHTPPPDVPLSPSNSYPTHDFPPPPSNNLPDNSSYSSHPPPSNNIPDSSSYPQPPSNNIPDNPSYPQPPSNNIPDNPSYSKPPYQSYPQEPPPPPQHFPQNYPSHEAPTFSYPNFQTYPSFADTSLPTAPPNNNYPPFHQGGTDASYPTSPPPPPPPAQNYPSAAAQYNNSSSSSRHGSSVPEAAAVPTKVYHYDSSYQPPPENVALAHKAARFAVGALAFDDVAIAVDYLKKSLELLTNPSSSS